MHFICFPLKYTEVFEIENGLQQNFTFSLELLG